MKTQTPDVADAYLGTPPTIGEYEGFEVYPMPAFVRFPVADPAEAAQWYIDGFGFGAMYMGPEVDGIPMLVHLRRRRYQDILLVTDPAERPGAVNFDCTGELDEIAARASAALGRPVEPELRPWGTRDLIVEDPWGNRLTMFSAPDEPAGTIDEVMEAAAEGLGG